jgi:LmbE family N-acetylglucosaminyl deacetylase
VTTPDLTHVPALGTILSVWGHPDDETYLAGGVMAAARDRGQRVVCASASAGEHGTDDPCTWPPDRLGRVRRWEAAAAMAALGVDEHHVCGLPDGALADHDDEGVAWVSRLLADTEPDTILTFAADGMTFHPDHIAVHRWVTEAWREHGCGPRLLYAAVTVQHLAQFAALYDEWGVYMTDARPPGTTADDLALHVCLDGEQLDRKITALRAMATQTAAAIAALGDATYATLVAEEAFVDAGSGSG